MTFMLLNGVFALALMLHPVFVKCELYYVKQSEHSSCPYMESCLTLAQLTTNIHQYLGQNTTLVLLSGRHSLSETLLVTNVNQFELFAIDYGENHQNNNTVSIECTSNASLELMHCNHVNISHVIFIGCGGFVVDSVGEFSLNYSTFMRQRVERSALIFNYVGEVNITHSYFVSNRGSSCTFYNPSIEDSFLKHCGGAIYATTSNIWIERSFFMKNMQAIFAELNTNMTFSTCTFEQNYYTNPSNDALANTCVIAGSSTHILVINSSFSNNRGGGVFWISESKLEVEWNNFSHNGYDHGYGNGGIIYSDHSTVTLNRNTFTHSYAYYGGVIICLSSTFIVTMNTFNNNIAEGYGGVFYTYSSHIFITKCYFHHNRAFLAGVLAVYEGTVKIDQSLFWNNGANGTIGESGVMQSTFSSLEINRTLFIQNEANDAGVLSLYKSNLTSSRTSFLNNTSNYKGIFHSKNSTLLCYDIHFAYNIGKFSVMYLAETNATFSGLTFSQNIGSLLVVRGLLLFSRHSTFNHNEAANNDGDNLLLQRAQYQGGGITSFYSTLYFRGETVFHNNQGENGGALYAVKSLSLIHIS